MVCLEFEPGAAELETKPGSYGWCRQGTLKSFNVVAELKFPEMIN